MRSSRYRVAEAYPPPSDGNRASCGKISCALHSPPRWPCGLRRHRRTAQPAAAPFPAGKPVSLHVGVTPGGGNDNVMRMVARHIGKYLPGHPNVVAKNTPGAGGRRLAGLLANTAPRDGTELAQLHRGLVIEQLLGEVTLPFKLQDLTWLGSPTAHHRHLHRLAHRARCRAWPTL